jgi:hypothetical protein
LACRALSLTVELFHNSGAFSELTGLLHQHSISPSAFLRAVDGLAAGKDSPVADLYDAYLEENVAKLRDNRAELVDYLGDGQVVDLHISGELGSSELYKARALAQFWRQEDLHDIAFDAARGLLRNEGALDNELSDYLTALRRYSLLRKQTLHETEVEVEFTTEFDFLGLEEQAFHADPRRFRHQESVTVRIAHSAEQRRTIATYLKQYGTSVDGLGRLLLRAHVNKLYRSASQIDTPSVAHRAA